VSVSVQSFAKIDTCKFCLHKIAFALLEDFSFKNFRIFGSIQKELYEVFFRNFRILLSERIFIRMECCFGVKLSPSEHHAKNLFISNVVSITL
jgi:hypothetical protein